MECGNCIYCGDPIKHCNEDYLCDECLSGFDQSKNRRIGIRAIVVVIISVVLWYIF